MSWWFDPKEKATAAATTATTTTKAIANLAVFALNVERYEKEDGSPERDEKVVAAAAITAQWAGRVADQVGLADHNGRK